MNIGSWIVETGVNARTNGVVTAGRQAAQDVHHKALQFASTVRDPGTPVYEREWDLLVVLDACRFDLMCEVADQYGSLDDVERFRSLDSMTLQWMHKNFVSEYAAEMSETAYICGNPFSAQALSPGAFAELTEVWNNAWEDPGTVPPRAVTDATIDRARTAEDSHVIAHYLQPHCPFIPAPELSKGIGRDEFGDPEWRDVWQKVRFGDLSKEEAWDGYRANLEIAMDEVELLLANVDADRAVVTSDHGNSLGTWGVYGHPPGMPMDCLRVVPWIETTATDTGTHDPESTFNTDVTSSRDEQLAALGYR